MGWNCGFCALLGAGICSLIALMELETRATNRAHPIGWCWLSLWCSAFWVSWQWHWEEGWQMPDITKTSIPWWQLPKPAMWSSHVYSYKTSYATCGRFSDQQAYFLCHPTCKGWHQGFQKHRKFISIPLWKAPEAPWDLRWPKDVLLFLYSVRGPCQTLDAHHLHAAIRKAVDAGSMVYGRSPIAAPKMGQRIAIVGERIPQVKT